MQTRDVVIVVFDGFQSLDALGPLEVFATATRVLAAAGKPGGYRPVLASVAGGAVTAESGATLGTVALATLGSGPDTVVIAGGDGARTARHDAALRSWVTTVRARRTATVCTGAFIAAEADLLDGRRVTTHWARAGQLAADYPSVTVDPDPIYLRDGPLWSSAGVTAGIDLALALVEEDLGPTVAQTVARWLVMFLHRPGGQTQFAAPVWVPRAERRTVRAVQHLVESAPGGDHRVAALAAAAAMSVRHFSRCFTAEVGTTPARFVERVRLECARRELETSPDTLEAIARRCGLGSAETLRRVFSRHLGVAPDAYRRRFAHGTAATA